MTKEELTNKLVRLGNMMHEAKEIIGEIENDVNGRLIADCPDVTIAESLPESTIKRRFVNASRSAGVYHLRDLLLYRPSEVMKWRNTGKRSIVAVQEALEEKYGITWEE